MPEQTDQDQRGTPCPHCGHHNPVGALVCRSCGKMLQGDPVGATYKLSDTFTPDEPQRPPTDPEKRKLHFPPGAQFAIHIREVDSPLIYKPPADDPLIVGRRNANAEFAPDVDMYPFAGYYLGVSRRHALIYRKGSQLMIEDLGSSNGTFVDGNALEPNKPYPLYDGVEVRLGRLHFTVSF